MVITDLSGLAYYCRCKWPFCHCHHIQKLRLENKYFFIAKKRCRQN